MIQPLHTTTVCPWFTGFPSSMDPRTFGISRWLVHRMRDRLQSVLEAPAMNYGDDQNPHRFSPIEELSETLANH